MKRKPGKNALVLLCEESGLGLVLWVAVAMLFLIFDALLGGRFDQRVAEVSSWLSSQSPELLGSILVWLLMLLSAGAVALCVIFSRAGDRRRLKWVIQTIVNERFCAGAQLLELESDLGRLICLEEVAGGRFFRGRLRWRGKEWPFELRRRQIKFCDITDPKPGHIVRLRLQLRRFDVAELQTFFTKLREGRDDEIFRSVPWKKLSVRIPESMIAVSEVAPAKKEAPPVPAVIDSPPAEPASPGKVSDRAAVPSGVATFSDALSPDEVSPAAESEPPATGGAGGTPAP